MSWIEQVPVNEAEGVLEKIYAGAKGRTGKVAHIIQLMSLRPKLLGSFMNFYVQLMHGDSALSRSEKELLATVTSCANHCVY